MRDVLRQLGVRQRISLGALVLVAAILVIARLVPHHEPDSLVQRITVTGTGAPVIEPTSVPSVIPSGPLLHSPVPPTRRPGTATPQSVARAFTNVWLHHDGVTAAAWWRAVAPYTTGTLTTELSQTDPQNVPANRITGAVTIVDDTTDTCLAQVPTDTGTLGLTMTLVHGGWLVSDIDWTRR